MGRLRSNAPRTSRPRRRTRSSRRRSKAKRKARASHKAPKFSSRCLTSRSRKTAARARLDLLRFFSEQHTLTQQTQHLAQGTATLFLTPQDVNLKLQVPSARNL